MNIEFRKITYQVHFDQKDEDGNPIGELSASNDVNGAPFALYAHQIGELPDRIAAILEQAEIQLNGPPAPPAPAATPNGDGTPRRGRTRPRR